MRNRNPRTAAVFTRARTHRHLRQHPHDIAQWLEFAAFQGVCARTPTHTRAAGLTRAPTEHFVAVGGRAAAGAADDKRISVLQAALRENGRDERLLLSYLSACQRRWEHADLERLWRKFLAEFPDSAHLWLAYIDFCSGNFAAFSVPAQRDVYAKAVAHLTAARRRETGVWWWWW